MRTVVLSSTLRIVGFISLKSGTTVKCEEMPLASPAGPETAILTTAGRACPQRAGWLANAAKSGDLARSRRAEDRRALPLPTPARHNENCWTGEPQIHKELLLDSLQLLASISDHAKFRHQRERARDRA